VDGANTLLSRILEAEAHDERSAAAIRGNGDGVEPGPGAEVDRAVNKRWQGAGTKLPAESIRTALHGSRHRVAGNSGRGTWNAEWSSDTEDSLPRCVTNVSENLQSCTEDGRRPPGVGFQESASNHPELLRSKGVVVSVRGKGVRRGRQVSVEKMSESEPSDDASSRI